MVGMILLLRRENDRFFTELFNEIKKLFDAKYLIVGTTSYKDNSLELRCCFFNCVFVACL